MFLFKSDECKLSRCLKRYFEKTDADLELSKNSVSKYKEVACKLENAMGDVDVRNLDGQSITKLKVWLNEKKLSASRKNHYLVVLKNVLRYLEESEGLKVYNHSLIKKFSIPAKQITFLTKDELKVLVDSIGENSISRLRLKTAVICMISCGCRVSELLKLNIADIDMETGRAQVIAKGGRLHTLIFNDMAIGYIKKYIQMRADSNPSLFITSKTDLPKTWQVNDLERALRNQGKRAGFTQSIHPHLLRRSAGTMLFHQNASLSVVQRFLGHATPTVTERYYLGATSFSEVERVHKEIMNFNFND